MGEFGFDMVCLSPITAYRSKEVNASGKRSLVFNKQASHSGIAVQIPCGQCIGCRLQRSLDWAVRCMHEKSMHEVSSFITLTYNDDNLPSDGSLHYRDFQLFMKRLREKSEFKFKFYMCGEYGETTNRPHYHALLFGCDFNDRTFYKRTKSGDRLDTSQLLEDTWSLGFCTVGDVTFESCAYVARYITKKVTGKAAADHYMGREPEFTNMSNGIGARWLERYGDQTYRHDNIIINGKKARVPRYYDNKYELVDSKRLESIKRLRVRKARVVSAFLKEREATSGLFNTYRARDVVSRARLSLNRRDVDDC